MFLGLLVFGVLIGMLSGILILYTGGLLSPGEPLNFLQAGGNLAAARIVQICSQLGLFIFPPLALAWLVDTDIRRFLGVRNLPQNLVILSALVLMFLSLPFVHWLSDINHAIKLPDTLSGLENWIKAKETQAEELTNFFLSVETVGGLLVNLLMVALIPAVGEELVFRSVLQKYLIKFTGNHAGIILTALIFSIIHLQFYGLLPRFVLGLFLGYAFFYTGSIGLPMLMHFVNNGVAVIAFYLHHNGIISSEMEKLGEGAPFIVVIASAALSMLVMVFISRRAA